MTVLSETLRIAVLVNHPPNTRFHPEVRQAFVDSFTVVAPHARVDFYDPIEKRAYPDPFKYDLVVLSGGKADASASDPWILETLAFVRDTAQTAPSTKILGICWGHQAIARAFGGHVADVPTGPIAGLVGVNLTEEGRKFFPFIAAKGSYLASQFHVREVATPAPGFIALAENNESFVSESNTILSFQAHPEIDGAFAKKILVDDDTTYIGGATKEQVEQMIQNCANPQDGIYILRRVVQWIKEPPLLSV